MTTQWMWPGTRGMAAKRWGGVQPELLGRLRKFYSAAEAAGLANRARPISSFRNNADQWRAIQQVAARHGWQPTPQGFKGLAAPVGRSRHQRGAAIDWSFANDDVRKWFHENAPKYGLHFPLKNDAPHMQLMADWKPAAIPGPNQVDPQPTQAAPVNVPTAPASMEAPQMDQRKPLQQPSLFGNLASRFSSPGFLAGAVMFDEASRGGGIARGAAMLQQAQQNEQAMRERQAEAVRRQPFDAARLKLLQAQAENVGKPAQLPWWASPDGKVHPAMQQYRAMGRPQTNVNVNNRAESAYDKEIGKQYAKLKIEGVKGAKSAQRDLNNLRVMEQAINDPNLYTGTGGKTIQALKRTASTLFGVNLSGVASGEVVDKLSKEIALGLKDNLPGPLSNSDRDFLVSMAPGLSTSPEGNRQMIRLGMLQKQYQIARSRAANEYARKNRGRIDQGFDDVLAGIEDNFAQKFSGIIQELRQGAVPNRSPIAGIPQLKSAAEYMQLPSGAKFLDPEGNIRVKP